MKTETKALSQPASGVWPDLIAPQQHENPAPGWEDPRLPDFRLIWKVARDCGYSVGIHGSLKRDVDLIAAPWTDEAVGNAELVERLCAALPAKRVDGPEHKPLGRVAVTLQMDGWYKAIDLSITPRVTRPADEDEVRADLREDRQYRAGFMSGYSVGVSCERKNDHSEYHARLAKMTVLISDAAHVFIDRETL